jgi:hypothetical protein
MMQDDSNVSVEMKSGPTAACLGAPPEAVKFKVREIIILPLTPEGAQADKVSFEKSIYWSIIWPAQAFKRFVYRGNSA